MITFFRVLVILFCCVTVSVVVIFDFEQPILKFLAAFGLMVLLLTLLLFANLCADMKNLMNREDPYPVALLGGGGELTELLNTTKSEGLMQLDKIPLRDVGDRKFKADATKVCKNCKWIDEPGRICQKDDLSLEGITVSAVGCQYWALGLTVTEAEPRQDEGSSTGSGGKQEET